MKEMLNAAPKVMRFELTLKLGLVEAMRLSKSAKLPQGTVAATHSMFL